MTDNHHTLKMIRKEKNAMKEYNNALKRVDDNTKLKPYQQPICEVLTYDLRKYTLDELKNHRYNTNIDNEVRPSPYKDHKKFAA